jgi:diaminohydroxyphosphoribosylaminopyrimidine deaminase/5-amino-6-(5-phosphoribosylamino)uracil reductase
MPAEADARRFLLTAAKLALRGHGGAEPNPMVGCVIVRDGQVVGRGWHRRCGEAHAEVNALAEAGDRARGACAYVTLEPCNHHGRTGPCSHALIAAGVSRVVFATRDPNPTATGGMQALASAGIEAVHHPLPEIDDLNAPFVKRVMRRLPWVTAKWAQTLDGAIATRTGESQWISCETSRRRVHRERARVDAILTGMGTVRADDPRLTARGTPILRRARRVVVDRQLELDASSALIRTIDQAPLTVACSREALAGRADHADALRAAGADVLAIDDGAEGLTSLMRDLHGRLGVSTVLVEAGGGLVGKLLEAGLIDELWAFIAPIVMGDAEAATAVRGLDPTRLIDATRWRTLSAARSGDDLELRLRRRTNPTMPPVDQGH